MPEIDATEERDWRNLTAAEFLKGYAESDSIYDGYYLPCSDELSDSEPE